MKTVEKELLKATKRKPMGINETDQQFRLRIMKGVDRLSDKAFYKLSAEAQRWVVAAVKAYNKKKKIRAFPKTPIALVQKHWEDIDSKVLQQTPEIISRFIDGQNGIYALYSDGNLYYVGLAKNLLARLMQHLEDRLYGKWDRFSVYLTGSEFRKDLETLLLRIAKPQGCKNRGNFVGSNNLSWEAKSELRTQIDLIP